MQYSQFQIKISVCGVSGYKNDRSFAGYCSKTYFIVEHIRLTVGLQSPIIPLRLFHRTIRVPHCQGIGCSPNCERIREWHGFVTIEDIDEGPRHCDMSECPSRCVPFISGILSSWHAHRNLLSFLEEHDNADARISLYERLTWLLFISREI